jgi:hypothetical protein
VDVVVYGVMHVELRPEKRRYLKTRDDKLGNRKEVLGDLKNGADVLRGLPGIRSLAADGRARGVPGRIHRGHVDGAAAGSAVAAAAVHVVAAKR